METGTTGLEKSLVIIILKAMKLDVNNVIKLASTKPFGFKSFYPGPGIGGHCIPIDPYYLYWRAKELIKILGKEPTLRLSKNFKTLIL